MEHSKIIIGYFIYLPIVIALTIFVSKMLFKNGKLFMIDIFKGKEDSRREFIHVEDAAESSVKILDPKFANQHIILTGNQLLSINELLNMIKEILNDDEIKIKYTPGENNSHYEMTPYTFNPKYGKKMYPEQQRDLGQGILQMIETIHRDFHPDMKEKLGCLLDISNNEKEE